MKTIISQLNLQVYHRIFSIIMISNRYIIMNLILKYQVFWPCYVKPKSKHIIYKISIQKYSKSIHDFMLVVNSSSQGRRETDNLIYIENKNFDQFRFMILFGLYSYVEISISMQTMSLKSRL